MAHLAVNIVLLFFACVHAVPAPARPKFVLMKNSGVGLGVAEQLGNVHGSVESNQFIETPIESPIDTGNDVPDVVVLDNVNAGGAFAGGGNTATGVVKDNEIADDSKKTRAHNPNHEPSNRKISFAKDTSLGLGVARQRSQAHGLVQSNKFSKQPNEEPEDTGNKSQDIAVVDNFNVGAGFASNESVATGVLKNNKFANDPTKGAKIPFMGFN